MSTLRHDLAMETRLYLKNHLFEATHPSCVEIPYSGNRSNSLF